jgi:hemin uptake protein HemP
MSTVFSPSTDASQALPALAETQSATPVVDCADLLLGHRQAFITHDGCVYVLRLTRGNKLILTK